MITVYICWTDPKVHTARTPELGSFKSAKDAQAAVAAFIGKNPSACLSVQAPDGGPLTIVRGPKCPS